MVRYVLLVGINQYLNVKFNFNGCVNDVESFVWLFGEVYGFGVGEIEFLCDFVVIWDIILLCFDVFFFIVVLGDMVVFGFLGYGIQVVLIDLNELDMKDECIVLYEVVYNLFIKDDEFYWLFNCYIDGSIKFIVIYDCCYLGMMFWVMEMDKSGDFVDDVVNCYVDIGDFSEMIVKFVVIGLYNVLGVCGDDQIVVDVWVVGLEKMFCGVFSYVFYNFL